MAQRTLAAGFTDTGIEKAAAKSAPAGKNIISVNPVIPSTKSSAKSAKSASKKFVPIRGYISPRAPRSLR